VRWKRLALTLVVVATVACVVIGFSMNSLFYGVRDVSIGEVVSDPQSFDGVHVRLCGYVVEWSGYMFGPKYVLRDFDDGVEIALVEKVNLEPYVSFVFDGRNYTKIRNIKVSVVGYVRYIGPVMNAPSFSLNVEKVEPSVSDLETVVAEFLETTDVANGVWDGTVEITEVYEHKFGGKVLVVKYTTMYMGHPHFMCEAIEQHTAVITINVKEEAVSAFCVHGSDMWDLINQRWVSVASGNNEPA